MKYNNKVLQQEINYILNTKQIERNGEPSSEE